MVYWLENDMNVLKAVIWAAVSTEIQATEDKFSIAKQISDAEELAQINGWRIVDTLVVAGHSRDYYTLDDVTHATASQGITAFVRLKEHIRLKDFDIFICRDANRFARKASLLHEIVDRIIFEAGARIYSLSDGWVDKDNADIFSAFKGYETNKQIRWLVEATKNGKIALAKRGLPTGSQLPVTHRLVRDASGKAQYLELIPEKVALFQRIAELIVDEKLPYHLIGAELKNRWGYVSDSGRVYSPATLYCWMKNPYVWGHSTYASSSQYDVWVYDDTEPVPDGVLIYRDVVPTVFQEPMRSRLIAELKRRRTIKGRASPQSRSFFSGLIQCAECGRYYTIQRRSGYGYYRCSAQYQYDENGVFIRNDCGNSIREDKLVAFVDSIISYLREKQEHVVEFYMPEMIDYSADIDRLTRQIDSLIGEMLDVSDSLRESYRKRLTLLDEQRQKFIELQREQSENSHQMEEGQNALMEITDSLWDLPTGQVNALLHRLFNNVTISINKDSILTMVKK